MAMMFVGCLVVIDVRNILLFVSQGTYGAGVFFSARTRIAVELWNS